MRNYILIIITIFIVSCGSKTVEETPSETVENTVVTLTDEQLKNAGIVTGKTEIRNMSTLIKLNGSIDVPPQNMVSISFPLGGYLKSTKLLPGMHVSKGEVLAVLEDVQFIQLQQDYLITQSKLELLESEYNRQKELNATKAGSDKMFQQAKSELDGQLIMIKSIAEKLRLIGINPERLNSGTISRSVNLYSPINGFVSKVNVNIGKYTSPTDVLFELVNPEDIHLNLSVFEKDVAKLQIGQKVVAINNESPEIKHEAEIILISKNLDENRAAEVHCHFEDYDKTLLPGMYMSAEVEIKSHNALTVPLEAIVKWEAGTYIFIEKGKNTYEMLEVKTGVDERGFQEILPVKEAFPEDMKVVTTNAYVLLMQMKNTGEEE
jgi:cobalt-zinc-cadmium efflux system membrane fusion protein